MARSRGRITSAGSTLYSEKHLVIARSGTSRRRTDGHDQPWHIATSFSSFEPTKSPVSQPRGPQTANLSLVAPGSPAAGPKIRGGQLDQIPIV